MTASEASPSSSSSQPPASPAPADGERSVAARVLDALVYLPAGAVLGALEDVPETVAKGRVRVGRELRNAKVVGRFVVDLGVRQLRQELQSAAGDRPATPATPAAPGRAGQPDNGGARPRPQERERRRAPGTPRPPAKPHKPAASRDPEVDRAIPDYDTLAASQVVRRLDGLGRDELRAVVRHERATRGRRTILQRAEQLLGPLPHDRASREPAGPRKREAPGAPGGADTT